MHFPLDIIASQYDLAQTVTGTAGYTNIQWQFATTQPSLASYLNSLAESCGGSVVACAASNPCNSNSLATCFSNMPTAGTTLTSNSRGPG